MYIYIYMCVCVLFSNTRISTASVCVQMFYIHAHTHAQCNVYPLLQCAPAGGKAQWKPKLSELAILQVKAAWMF